MKICFFGIYDKSYSRNDVLISGLKLNDVEVVECQADWRDKKRYSKIIKQLKSLKNDYDFVYAGYPAPVPVILAKIFSKKPVIMDAFYSMYDAVVNDRQEIPFYHPRALKLLILDWVSILMADHVIVDTNEHKKYWSKWLFMNSKKISVVYVGVNDKLIYPISNNVSDFIVHFHGKYIPLQGVPKIIETANILKQDQSIKFRLIGSGKDSGKANELIKKYNLNNIEQIGRVAFSDLNKYMSEASVVLGVFGDKDKACRVIPNKIFEGLAAKKPVITLDTPAVREIFSNSELLLVDSDPKNIASAIKRLANDTNLRNSLAENGYNKVKQYFPKETANSLINVLRSIR